MFFMKNMVLFSSEENLKDIMTFFVYNRPWRTSLYLKR